jgi:serine/threonine-protein kinase
MEGSGAAEATALTHAFGRALTPRYASPEQLHGSTLTTASDVYSLGIVAYELLVGVPPFAVERPTAAALARLLAADEAPRASTRAVDPKLRARLRGDLDAILSRALKKRPEERYPTVDALADDWRRHLAGERIDARPDSVGYRMRRMVGRHGLPLAVAGVMVLALALALGAGATALVIAALLSGLGAALWQARRARAQALRAQTEARTAHEVQMFLEGIFRANSAGQQRPVQARQRTAKELLDIGAARIRLALEDSPEAKLRLLKLLAQMYEDMEEPVAAAELLRLHQQLTARLYGARSVRNGEALACLGFMLAQAEDVPAAGLALDQAGLLLEGRADAPAQAAIALDLGRATLAHRTDPAQGIEPARRALDALRRQPVLSERLLAHSLLARSLHYAKRLEEARLVAEEGVAAAQGAPAEAFGSTIDMHIELGRIAGELGQVDAAREQFRAAIDLAEHSVGPAGHHTLMCMSLLGQALADNGRLLEGLQWLDRAAAALEAASDTPDRSWQMPMVHEYAAGARLRAGRPRAALDAASLGLRHFDVARNNVYWAVRLH